VGDDARLLRLLADYCLQWEELQGVPRRYSLRFVGEHVRLAGRWNDLERLLMDWRFLEAKVEAGLGFGLSADFAAAREGAPRDLTHRRLLGLLEEALRADLHFITRHPTTLFQCLWNRGWSYDSPRATAFYQPSPADAGLRAEVQPNPRLSTWLEGWRAGKEAEQTGFLWVRSLLPPDYPLGTARRAVLSGHTKGVQTVRYAPDGRRLASGSLDGTVRIWDAASGEESFVLKGHPQGVRCLAFSPDGKRLIVGSWGKTLHLWDLVRQRQIRRWRTSEMVTSVAFSADGRLLGVGFQDGQAVIRDGMTYERRRRYRHTGELSAIAFSPDGSVLACAVADVSDSERRRDYVRLWSLYSDQHFRVTRSGMWAPTCLAFTPDGATLVWGTLSGGVYRWKWRTRNRPRLMAEAYQELNALAVAPSGEDVAGASGREIYVWNLKSGAEKLLGEHSTDVHDVAYSPDGMQLASASSDLLVFLWRTDRADHGSRPPMPARIVSLTFSPDGKYLALGPIDGEIEFWTVGDWARERLVPGTWNWVTAIAFSPDSQRVAFASREESVEVWDLTTGTQVACLEGHTERLTCLAFSQDGSTLASGSWDGSVSVWDVVTGRLISRIQMSGSLNRVDSVIFSLDGARIITGTWDGITRVWGVADGQLVRRYEKHNRAVTSVAWSADGRYLATSSWGDQQVLVWEASSGRLVRIVPARGNLASIAFETGGPWQARADSQETEIVALPGEHAVAWFPPPLHEIYTHPGGRIWAGRIKVSVHVFTVEGRAESTRRSDG
jgi:WD40 repeat protein